VSAARSPQRQSASRQARPAPQSTSSAQAGLASPGVLQKPATQIVPEQPGPHCPSDSHGVRQIASTQSRPAAQPAFDVHCGLGRSSGRQRPRSQLSAGFVQSEALAQAA
jgi:hypothetical protein